MMENKRVFVSLELGDEAIKEVARVQALLEKKRFSGKLTELGNLHLTLKFLGEIDDAMLRKVKSRLKKIVFKSFNAKLGNIGIFFHSKEPKIIWIKLEGKEVWNLQKAVDIALEGLFNKEQRFMSHITIARVKHAPNKTEFVEHIRKIHVKEIDVHIHEIKLKESILEGFSPKYIDLLTVKGKYNR